tara:strand:+ start:618 stop:3878 length:3261 start_codon:yes stop_codon:yes gene_type:complete
MNSFVDIDIIECNRLSSEEGKTNNDDQPALWHNKLGRGVTINPGDTIQVSQAFVSEDGAGDSVIEFSGEGLDKQHTINYIQPKYYNACGTIPQGFDRIDYISASETLDLVDNKASIVLNYYKNMNGENYIQMPRKFVCLDSVVNALTPAGKAEVWLASESSVHLGHNASSYGPSGGLPFHQVSYFDRNSRIYFYCDADYYYSANVFRQESASNTGLQDFFKLRNDNTNYTIYARKENYFLQFGANASSLQAVNASTTLPISLSYNGTPAPGQQITGGGITSASGVFVVAFDGDNITTNIPITIAINVDLVLQSPREQPAPASYKVNYISDMEYYRYSERLNVEVVKGFNSPSNIANDITNQLRKTADIERIKYDKFTNAPNFTPQKTISCYLESNTYKVFNCMNLTDMSDKAYDVWNKYNASQGQPSQQVIDYLNAFQFIGVKRPDLWDYGRTLMSLLDTGGASLTILEDLNRGAYTSIGTTLLWTKANVEILNELFKLQANYPELFKCPFNPYGDGSSARLQVNVDNARFLHLAPYKYNYGITGNPLITKLGTDDINGSGSIYNDSLQNNISLPMFFFWNKLQQYNNFDTATGTAVDLVYGWGQKITSGSTDYIGFYVGSETGGLPLPKQYHDYADGTTTGTIVPAGTLLGWDKHWTAYSTCVIALTDGWTDMPYDSELKTGPSASITQPQYNEFWGVGVNPQWQTAEAIALAPAMFIEQLKKVYMGANEPLLNFDNVSGRFNFSQLHTPEYIGNDIRAGATPTDNTEETIPVNPNADNKVYKINKRITNTNWTTAMIPFSCNVVMSASGNASTSPYYDLQLMNYNFDAFQIFDSKSGITIADFGVSEDAWKDSLWGILGFTYNQFNTPKTPAMTFTTRINESNVKQLNFATTNADITSAQTIQFRTNAWGVPIFNQQVPVTYYWNGLSRNTRLNQLAVGTREEFVIQNYPPISQVQDSIKLVGLNLPRKMLKPYYCIRSDILESANYIGGPDSGQTLPIISVVNKINGYGDFYFSEQSNMVFTATRRKTITAVTTSIHYPDQSYANVNLDSAVIYKITRNQPAVSNILADIMAQQQQKKGVSKI